MPYYSHRGQPHVFGSTWRKSRQSFGRLSKRNVRRAFAYAAKRRAALLSINKGLPASYQQIPRAIGYTAADLHRYLGIPKPKSWSEVRERRGRC